MPSRKRRTRFSLHRTEEDAFRLVRSHLAVFKSRQERLILVLVLVLVSALVSGWFVNAAWLSSADAGAPVEISVEEGMSASAVRNVLTSNHLVTGWAYRLYGLLDSATHRPKAGKYAFRRGTSYRDIARTLALGVEREDIKLRIIEGKTVDDERALLETHGVDPEVFTALVGASENVAPFDRALEKTYPFLSVIPDGMSLEGYLFPDTYQVWKDSDAIMDALIHKQLDELREQVIEPYADAQKASGMTWHEIITLASIVEAEAPHNEERKIVAGIFLNRLRAGMRLQSDATLNYAIGAGRSRATYSDLADDTPYNSYKHDGLPPGPINNPSLSSIVAVLEPAETNYYFFLSDPQGRMYYASTGAGHQANRARAFGE